MTGLLVIQIRRIGDLALTFPVLAALQAAGHRVTALVPEPLVPLMRAVCPDVRAAGWRRGLLLHTLRALREERYEAVLDLTRTDRSAFLTRCARASRRVGYAEYARNWKRLVYSERHEIPVSRLHTLDYHLALPRAAGLITSDDTPALPRPAVSPVLRAHLPDGEPWIVLHPGTAKPEKFWPARHWRELISSLAAATRSRLILTGGGDPHEQQTIREILTDSPAPVIDLSGRLGIADTCALTAGAQAVVSVDTGVMHFAALWQIPQVALFGPTQPFQWMPRHPRAAVLSSGSFRARGPLKLKKKQRLAIHHDASEWEPFEAVARRYHAHGQGEFHIGFREGEMAAITPAHVMEALGNVLAATPGSLT